MASLILLFKNNEWIEIFRGSDERVNKLWETLNHDKYKYQKWPLFEGEEFLKNQAKKNKINNLADSKEPISEITYKPKLYRDSEKPIQTFFKY